MDAYQGFVLGNWNNEIDVADFIRLNYVPYDGDASFLAEATERTRRLNGKVNDLLT